MPVLISHFSHRRKKQGGLAKTSSHLIHALKEKPKPPGVQLDLIAVAVVNCKFQEVAEKKAFCSHPDVHSRESAMRDLSTPRQANGIKPLNAKHLRGDVRVNLKGGLGCRP
jgi:hypothetical protein